MSKIDFSDYSVLRSMQAGILPGMYDESNHGKS